MKLLAKLLILLGFTAAMSGCVVAPVGPRPHAYIAIPAPVVVVRPAYYGPYYDGYYRRW